MTARVRVDYDINSDGLAIWLAMGQPGQRLIAEAVRLEWRTTEPAVALAEPTLRLPDDVARALLDALTAHYGGAPELQSLRKDYVAERGRVDKMIDHLIGGGAR
jgi:hypothetical protein